ncbi:MAG TPA: hypothetical protein VKW08_24890 [Xanthobacteraceae bacterium]|nr:hypothetical protein [Xanthobacteraceae bacterium]
MKKTLLASVAVSLLFVAPSSHAAAAEVISLAASMPAQLLRLNDLPLCGGEVNTARHGALRRIRFLIMQAVMRSTSGTNSLHNRIASGWQACCCSGVPRFCASADCGSKPGEAASPTAIMEMKRRVTDLCPAIFICRPVPLGPWEWCATSLIS